MRRSRINTRRHIEVGRVINEVAEEFDYPREVVLRESLRALLGQRLREVKAEVFEIRVKYGVQSVEELEEMFRQGRLEEALSRTDYQRLDHLEHRMEVLSKLMDELR